MKLLLDTHALIWALAAPRRLPERVVERLADADTAVYASAANTWEIAIKAMLGKIELDLDELAEEIRNVGFTELPVSVAHTLRLRELPAHHRDPFDRILVAQSLEEGLTLVTHDSQLRNYPAPILWE